MGSMEVYEAKHILSKGAKDETVRPPLGVSEKNIAFNRTRTTREVPSRYKPAITSNSVSAPVAPRRYPSPNLSRRQSSTASNSNLKRAQSAERKRPSTPPSLQSPSTPAHDASQKMQQNRQVPSGRAEGLWPSSTMRSLSVSFQSDTFSLPVSKKEKPVARATSDHSLRPSANVVHRQAETPAVQRKGTPERKTTPLRGRNASDQSENSRPVENSHPQVVDQHQSPSRTGGKVSSGPVNRSMDLTSHANRASSLPFSGRGASPMRRSPLSNGVCSGLQKPQSELASRLSYDQSQGIRKLSSSTSSISSTSSDDTSSPNCTIRSRSLPIPGSVRSPAQCKAPFLSSSPSRGMSSPSRTRPSSPFPSASSAASRSSSASSVLSFIADYRKGKKGANHIEDAHQLRLLYNKYLQWRFTNARADAAFSFKKMTAEKTLYNVWRVTSELQFSVAVKRTNLRQRREEIKLHSILDRQMDYLDDWALLEGEHSSSLAEAIKALEASTLHLPVTAGARAETHTLKSAICSAVDVMQALGSSIGPLLSMVEGRNCLVSELAVVTKQERAMLDEYVNLLASTAAMQVQENSIRTHLIQLKQASRSEEQPISTIVTLG